MSVLDVNSIASLEALNSALSQYRTASDEPFRRFAPIFLKKIELLEQLEPHFIKEIEQSEMQLKYAQQDYYACQCNPDRVSCSFEAGMVRQARARLERARNNLATYQSLMSKLQGVLGSYQSAANRYEGNLQNISSSIVPNFSSLIGKMKAYSSDGSDIFGDGGVGNTVESSYSLSALRDAAINAGVVGVAGNEKSGDATATGKTNNDSGKSSGGNKRKGVRSGKDATANVKGNPISATGVGVVAGVSVAAISGLILMHFRNHGVDDNFANREIDRALTEKYGKPFGFLTPEQQAKYVKDYNALSKAVEEDVKNKYAEEIVKLQKLPDKIKYDTAVLAKHVYDTEKELGIDWSIADTSDPTVSKLVKQIEEFNNDGSGFYAQLYKNNFTGEYTLAFRGSDNLYEIKHLTTDWFANNIKNAIGQAPEQYINAQKLGILINDLKINDKITITGHSLGGGLATVVGLTTRSNTITYNQAELTQGTITTLGLREKIEGSENFITAYHDRKEPLFKIQDYVNSKLSGDDNSDIETKLRKILDVNDDGKSLYSNMPDYKFSPMDKEEYIANIGYKIGSTIPDVYSYFREEYKINIPDDSSSNYFARIGKIVDIDSKGEHGIDSVVKGIKSTMNGNIFEKNSNYYVNKDDFSNNFKIQSFSEYPKVEDSSSKYSQEQVAPKTDVIRIISKK